MMLSSVPQDQILQVLVAQVKQAAMKKATQMKQVAIIHNLKKVKNFQPRFALNTGVENVKKVMAVLSVIHQNA